MKSIVMKIFTLTVMLLVTVLGHASTAAPSSSIDADKIRVFAREMAQQHQFDQAELEQLLKNARIHQTILDAISRPAEAKPWHEYRPIFVNKQRIKGGVAFWNDNALTLKKASQKYGVPAEIIVAIIGVETRYGQHKGRFPVIDSLSTLAFAYPPRSRFFRGELKQFLLMTREENINPLKQLGSYAGAMGLPQFIASSFRNYAVDFDGDGTRDLWNNTSDAIGSVANYFKRHGWKQGEPIAHRAIIRGQKYKKLLNDDLKPQWSLAQLRSHGVQPAQKVPAKLEGTLLELDTGTSKPEYWLGWDNFYVITRYNHSAHYSMAVFQLANEIRAQR